MPAAGSTEKTKLPKRTPPENREVPGAVPLTLFADY